MRLPAWQRRLCCAKAPTIKATLKETSTGACIAPGPLSEKANKAGNASKRTKPTIWVMGKIKPSTMLCSSLRGKEKPLLRKSVPTNTPRIKPIKPTQALRSPAAMRKTMRKGHPKKTKAPTITVMPSKKRDIGAEPPRGLNSFLAIEKTKAPNTKPIISGRRYCTTPALCIL